MKFGILLMVLGIAGGAADAQSVKPDWKLKIDKEGIKVYNRSSAGDKFNEIKTEVVYNCTASDLVAAVMDVANHKRWSYATKLGYVIKTIGAAELIFYKEISSPPTVSNRDLVARMTITQNSETKVVKIRVTTVAGYVAVKEDLVRVPVSDETWLITPESHGTIKVDYYLKVDPGGSISPFLVNLFATKGPYETFKSLKKEVELRKKTPVHYSFLD